MDALLLGGPLSAAAAVHPPAQQRSPAGLQLPKLRERPLGVEFDKWYLEALNFQTTSEDAQLFGKVLCRRCSQRKSCPISRETLALGRLLLAFVANRSGVRMETAPCSDGARNAASATCMAALSSNDGDSAGHWKILRMHVSKPHCLNWAQHTRKLSENAKEDAARHCKTMHFVGRR